MTSGKWWMQDSNPASLRALKDAPELKEMLFIIPQDSPTTPGHVVTGCNACRKHPRVTDPSVCVLSKLLHLSGHQFFTSIPCTSCWSRHLLGAFQL